MSFIFGVVLIVSGFCLLYIFCLCFWLICKKKRSPSDQRNVELGLRRSDVRPHFRTTRDMSSSRSLKSGYRRITEPEIKNGRLYGQDYFAIREHLTRTGTLFRDEKFPADKYSVSYNGRLEGVKVEPHIVDGWVRATDLYHHPEMVKDGISKDDVNQGMLGDCWFLAAMAGLSENKALFDWVVPAGQSFSEGYTGIFLFRFWRYGQWVEVVVDDLIPVKDRKPVFVHSKTRGEMWPCLLEKAYSKLQGSYCHLNAGMPMAAMVDFTGGFPQRDYQGLVAPHAYTVLGVVGEDSARATPNLVKIRNPHGQGEWTGAWSKSWLTRNRKERLVPKTGPGEFFMDVEDFRLHFDLLTICYSLDENWREKQRRTEVTPDCNQVEFSLQVNEDWAETMICFSQMGRRQLRDEMNTEGTLLNIKLSLSLSSDTRHTVMAEQDFMRLRSRTLHKSLRAGRYRILLTAETVDAVTPVLLRLATTCTQYTLS